MHQSGVPFEWPVRLAADYQARMAARRDAAQARRVPRRGRRAVPPPGQAGGRRPLAERGRQEAGEPVRRHVQHLSNGVAVGHRGVPARGAEHDALVPSYEEYYHIPQACHASLRDYRAALLRRGHRASHVDTIMGKTRAACSAPGSTSPINSRRAKYEPAQKWEDTRNIYDDKTASLIITLAQQAGYWLPSRRPKPVQVVNPADGTITIMSPAEVKALADRLYAEAKAAFKLCQSRSKGDGQGARRAGPCRKPARCRGSDRQVGVLPRSPGFRRRSFRQLPIVDRSSRPHPHAGRRRRAG